MTYAEFAAAYDSLQPTDMVWLRTSHGCIIGEEDGWLLFFDRRLEQQFATRLSAADAAGMWAACVKRVPANEIEAVLSYTCALADIFGPHQGVFRRGEKMENAMKTLAYALDSVCLAECSDDTRREIVAWICNRFLRPGERVVFYPDDPDVTVLLGGRPRA